MILPCRCDRRSQKEPTSVSSSSPCPYLLNPIRFMSTPHTPPAGLPAFPIKSACLRVAENAFRSGLTLAPPSFLPMSPGLSQPVPTFLSRAIFTDVKVGPQLLSSRLNPWEGEADDVICASEGPSPRGPAEGPRPPPGNSGGL